MDDLFDIQIRGRKSPIPVTKWLDVVAADPEIDLIHTLAGRNPRTGEMFDVPAANTGHWLAHPESIDFYLRFEGGEIVSEWVDRHVFAKAVELAEQLDAEVHRSLD